MGREKDFVLQKPSEICHICRWNSERYYNTSDESDFDIKQTRVL